MGVENAFMWALSKYFTVRQGRVGGKGSAKPSAAGLVQLCFSQHVEPEAMRTQNTK